MPHLITTLGPKAAHELGVILPHEHVFVDLRTWDKPGYGEADPAGCDPPDGSGDRESPGGRGDRAGRLRPGGGRAPGRYPQGGV